MDNNIIPAISPNEQAPPNIRSLHDFKNDRFFSNVLVPYLDALILEGSTLGSDNQYVLELDSIDIDDLYHLSSLFVEYDEDGLSCIYDNAALETISVHVLSVMRGNDKESREDFCEHLKDALLDYYRPRMQVLLDERLVTLYQEDAYEHGLMPHSDYDNDEIYWARR